MKHFRRLWRDSLRTAVMLALGVLGGSASTAQAQSTPGLSIESIDAHRVLIQWPAGDGLFALQSLESFDGADVWQPATMVPQLVAPFFRLELEAGDATRFFRLQPIAQPEPGVVPAPETLVTPPLLNVQESFADSIAFLHAGGNAVQIGVGPGTILPARASVLRGQVKKRDGSALAGAHVRVLNRPEFGFTYTRADGRYDLAVNGGPLYTLDFQLRGYCPAQRQVQAPLEDFRNVEDVVLIAMDPVATSVTFGTNAPIQVATSSVNTDRAGTRTATLVFAPGTSAALVHPNGSTQNFGKLTIRATEFTVGPGGPQAMPGPLPPSSAYTYAVELSADEAVAAGASTIRFDRLVHVYVDNFLNLPAGAIMPSAYYDRQIAAWVPQANGLVIQILGANGGVARVDVDGDSVEESSETLNAHAFSAAELQHLASTYAAGKTLWRMPVEHFTAMDFNCPENPASRANPNQPGDRGQGNDGDNAGGGGEVNLYSQIFRETIPLTGVPAALHYSSARVPGYRVEANLRLPLIGDVIPDDLLQVRADMEIAGRLQEFTYPRRIGLTGDFAWDGYDAYGRLVNETRRAFFTFYYFYPRVYGGHERGDVILGLPQFGLYGGFTSTVGHSEVGQAAAIKFEKRLTIPDHRRVGVGGWSLTPHHRYDAAGKILYLGDGTVQRPESLANGISVNELDPLFNARNVAAASDGSLFIVSRGQGVYRMATTGALAPITATLGPDGHDLPGTVVAGQGDFDAADGKPAAQVRFSQVTWQDITVGPDDSLYLRSFWSIVRITPDGIVRVVLGRTGSDRFPPDGSAARESGVSASAIGNAFVAVGQDHTVYYNDEWTFGGRVHDYVRKIPPHGRIATLIGPAGRAAGPFESQYFTEGPAIGVKTAPISGLGVAPDGAVYVAGGIGMVRINPGGLVEYVMNGAPFSGDDSPSPGLGTEGAPANSAAPYRPGGSEYVSHLTIGPDGRPYFSYYQGQGFVWKIDSAGLFQRVAGKWGGAFEAGSSPSLVQIGDVRDFTIDRSGTLTLLSQPPGGSGGGGNYSLRRIGPAFPGFEAGELQIPARHGGELYVFDASGLHLRTLDTLTGATNWQFTYDSRNLVTRMRDQDGLVTRIERAADGTPTAIVGPYGERNILAVDPQGFLSKVTDPAGNNCTLGYGTGGLLTSIEGPRGNIFGITYDAQGRATRMSDPKGGGLAITHAPVGGADYSTETITSLGERSTRVVKLAADGSSVAVLTNADLTVGSQTRMRDGGLIASNANGTVLTVRVAGDPRFRGQTAVPVSVLLEFPGGLRSAVSATRTAELLVKSNPLSLFRFTSEMTLNDQVFRDVYDATEDRLTSTTPEGRESTTEYDLAGRLTLERLGADSPVTYDYDASGRLEKATEIVDGDVRTRRREYNSLGQLERLIDPAGRVVVLLYDALGRPRQVTLPDGGVAGFEHDSEGHLTGVTPPGRPQHEFQYDTVGSLVRYSPPPVGTDDSVSYAYDLGRNLTNIVLPDGQVWNLVRGAAGRPERLKPGTGPEQAFAYHAATGQLTNIITSTGDGISFAYQGSLPVETRWSGVVTGVVRLEFDRNLQLAALAVNSERTAYSYDRDGLLLGAGDWRILRDALSGRVRTNSIGVVRETFAYDEQGKVTNTQVTVSGDVLSQVSLRYDRLNRVTNRLEFIGGATHADQYAYDQGGRLREARRDGTLRATFLYDANGNRTNWNGTSASYDAQDRVISQGVITYGWSRNGHRISETSGGSTTTFDYNVKGGLMSVAMPGTRIDYVLDPLGRRVGRKVDGVLKQGWLWLDQQIVAELDADSAVTRRFVYSEDSVAPVLMIAGSKTYFLVCDERGSVRRVVDISDGTVAQALDYDEFGVVLADSNPGFQPFGFTGGLYDPATGLVRMGARDYDPESGQWTSRDPIVFEGGQFSLYAYVHNDPVNHIDPSGTGPFLGFLDRNRQRAIDAAFDTAPGNNKRFEGALDRYDQSVKAAVLTGQVLVTTGQLLNSIAPGPRGPRASFGGGPARFGRGTGYRGRAPIGKINAPRASSHGPGLPGGPDPDAFPRTDSFQHLPLNQEGRPYLPTGFD